MSELTKEKALYEQLQTAVREMHNEIHAIYEPDGSEFFETAIVLQWICFHRRLHSGCILRL